MTNVEFRKAVAAEANMSIANTKIVLDALETAMHKWLEDGKAFKVADVLFDVKDVPAHEARNPSTGEKISIPASRKVVVKASKTLKDIVK